MCFAATEEINNECKGSTDRERFICQAAKKYGVTGHHVKRRCAQKDCLLVGGNLSENLREIDRRVTT